MDQNKLKSALVSNRIDIKDNDGNMNNSDLMQSLRRIKMDQNLDRIIEDNLEVLEKLGND